MPTNFERLCSAPPEKLADIIAKLVVHNVRTTVEGNFGTWSNDVMWQRYLREQRAAILQFLQKENDNEKAV